MKILESVLRSISKRLLSFTVDSFNCLEIKNVSEIDKSRIHIDNYWLSYHHFDEDWFNTFRMVSVLPHVYI